MTDLQTIRRRPDGSIDMDHYLDRGRYRRAVAAQKAAEAATSSVRKPLAGLATLVALLPFLGTHE